MNCRSQFTDAVSTSYDDVREAALRALIPGRGTSLNHDNG